MTGAADVMGMTAPRQILPGRIQFITRRCTQRTFLLRPDPKTRAIFEYCLGEAASQFQVELLAWKMMSNHYHAVVLDRLGQLPAFLERFHKMLACCLNARWERRENVWSTDATCVVYLPTLEAVLEKVVYTLANPMAAHLVDRIVHWPGATSFFHLDGRTTRHERPKFFFAEDGSMPEVVELRVTAPQFTNEVQSLADWARMVEKGVFAAEERAREERKKGARSIVGRKAVLSMPHTTTPTTPHESSKRRPEVSCPDRARLDYELERLKQFRFEHAEARAKFNEGHYSVQFPLGTYLLRWGLSCAPPRAA